MSKLQSLILGVLAGLLVIEGLVLYKKNGVYAPIAQNIPATSTAYVANIPPVSPPANIPIQTPTTTPIEVPVVPVVGYSDVLVVINSNSSSSEEIGQYFAAQRNVPTMNLVYINATTSEEIDDTEFQSIRSQIESYMTANNLKDKINYIVTTKGVPLKIKREDTWIKDKSASVDSELALILDPDSEFIGGSSHIDNPYFAQGGLYYTQKGSHFSHEKFGVYLVTRLDGYTVDDVKKIIDRSGPNTAVPSNALFVFDEDPNPRAPGFNDAEESASALLQNRGFNTELDKTATYLTNQQNVIGYVSWGSNDHNATSTVPNAEPNNSWFPGSIAATYVSSDGRTFDWPPVYGQSLIADMIKEGVTGAIGHVYEPYSDAMPYVLILFDLYTKGYDLAESSYAALPYLSWQEIVIGDPKTTITFNK